MAAVMKGIRDLHTNLYLQIYSMYLNNHAYEETGNPAPSLALGKREWAQERYRGQPSAEMLMKE